MMRTWPAKTPRITLLFLLFASSAYSLAWAATRWNVDAGDSQLNFSGTQGGVPFRGAFVRFTADIRFDPQMLDDSQVDVVIDTHSAKTGNMERDSAIRSDELLAADRWPTARYVVTAFRDAGYGKFIATGQLSLRGVMREIPLEFTYSKDASGAWLKGRTMINRLDFGVGQGEFANELWVGNAVVVQFSLKLKENPA